MPPRPKDDASPPTDPLRFEEALERLGGIVDGVEGGEAALGGGVGRLGGGGGVDGREGGELALEEALARFEEGVGLTRALGEQLTQAERRVEQLVREGGGLVVKPLV